jgi:hypothetical protein
VADLAFGLRVLLEFALSANAITEAEQAELWRRGWAALGEAAVAQAGHLASDEPAGMFMRLIRAAVASGRAHAASPTGAQPTCPERWGWRPDEFGTGEYATTRWRAQGRRIGWVDGNHLYLEPEAAYAEAEQLAVAQGSSMTVTPLTLRKRLKQQGLLVTSDARRQKLTVRRTLGGERREVLHVRADALAPPVDAADAGTEDGAAPNGPVPRAGCVANGPVTPEDWPAVTLLPPSGNGDVGRLGRSVEEEGVVGATPGSQHADGWSDWR